MFKNQWAKRCLILFIFCFLCSYVLPMDVFARVGGGRSSGSRGSRPSPPPRTYQTPKPSQPSKNLFLHHRPLQKPFNNPKVASGEDGRGSHGRNIRRNVIQDLGFGGNMMGEGGGIGLFEILLIGALLYGVYWFIKRRRQAVAPAGITEAPLKPLSPIQPPTVRVMNHPGRMKRIWEKG